MGITNENVAKLSEIIDELRRIGNELNSTGHGHEDSLLWKAAEIVVEVKDTIDSELSMGIKVLTWEPTRLSTPWKAEANDIAQYSITNDPKHRPGEFMLRIDRPNGGMQLEPFESLEAAKAAGQKDYEDGMRRKHWGY